MKGSIFIIVLLNIAAGYLLLLTGANILLTTSKVLLITPIILRLFKIKLEKGERIDQSLIILLYTQNPELGQTLVVRALWPVLRVIQVAHTVGETLEDYSTQVHLNAKSILETMADTAKRSTQTQTQTQPQSQSKDSTRSRKPRPHPIDTNVANQYRSWQGIAAEAANDDDIPTASSTYSDTEDPFADQATYAELPLSNIQMRTPAPARSAPYPAQPATALPQPPTPYSAATTPLPRSLDPTLFNQHNSDTYQLPTATRYPHAHSARLTDLVSTLSRLDTSVADYGPYNRDWEFKEFPPVTGRWAHFYGARQLWLANDLLGWWEGYPSPGSDGVYSVGGTGDGSQWGDEERDDILWGLGI
ncbi:hypothetical protein LTR70_007721 [Exophiala xenobiotica]|nr:hypothetical protein LTR70_007721 [Exophiala xenobiotica]